MAEFEELQSTLELDASDYISEANRAADASEEVGQSVDSTQESLVDINAAGAAAGGGMVALGSAMQRSLDDTRDMRESLNRMAVDLETNQEETRNLARDMQNATFPMNEVVGTMDELSQLGVESEERMRELAMTTDELADATGSSADVLASDLVPVVKALDGDLNNLEESADAFALAARNSSLEVEDIASTMSKLDFQQLEEMGLQSQEVAGLMAQFADETGYTGRQLESNFNAAVREADGDMDQLLENLELSDDAVEDWNQQVDEAGDVTGEYADAANESNSAMDEVRARFEDAKLAAAGALEPVSAVAPAMQAAGSAAVFMSTVNLSAVVPSLTAVATAAAPVVIPLLAITAAVGALYYAWDNNIFGIRDIAQDAFSQIQDVLSTIRDLLPESTGEAAEMAMDAFTTFHPAGILWDRRDEILDAAGQIRQDLEDKVDEGVEAATYVFLNWHPAGILYDHRDEIVDALPGPQEMREVGEEAMDAFADGIRELANAPADAAEEVAGRIRDKFPGSDAEEGPLSDITDSFASIPETASEQMADNAELAAEGGRDVASAASTATEATVGSTAGGATNVEVEFTGGALDGLWEALEPYVQVTVDGETEKKARRSSLQSSIDPS